MRRLAVFAALIGMVTAPMASVRAEGTADIYSKDGVTGPSFSRSTQCAAVYVLTMQMLGTAQAGYQNALKQATAWLAWGGEVSEGKDATAEMNRRKDAITAQTKDMNNDDYNTAIATELQNCLTVKQMFDGVEPFSSQFAQAVAGSGNSAEANKPDFNAGVDCATTYSVIAQSVGDGDANYDFFNDGVEMWTQYAIDQVSGSDKKKLDAVTKRATLLSNEYTKLLTNDQQAGIDRLIADRDRCKDLEQVVPNYFKNR
jgi:hypothetical protein